MGAWIEITTEYEYNPIENVAPLVGAWIEMSMEEFGRFLAASLPLWERGLKLDIAEALIDAGGRSPCGSVD